MALNRLQFLVLNNLADGPEPFSVLYVELLEDLDELVYFGDPENGEVGIGDVAYALEDLEQAGLIELDGASSGAVDGGRLADHYADLDEEIGPLLVAPNGAGPFQFSRGEWRFAITVAGEREWDNPDYAGYYPDDDDDDDDDSED